MQCVLCRSGIHCRTNLCNLKRAQGPAELFVAIQVWVRLQCETYLDTRQVA